MFVPFANKLSELHPTRIYILKLNNLERIHLEHCLTIIEKKFPSVDLWKPLPNSRNPIKLFQFKINLITPLMTMIYENYDRLYFDNPYYDYLDTLKSVQEYFDWAHLQDDKLILHIIETI